MPGGPSSRRPVGGRKMVSDSNSSAVSRWRDPSPPRASIISTPPPPRSAVRSPPSRSMLGSPPPRSILTSPSQRSTISVGLSEPPGDEDASAWLGGDDGDSWFQLDQAVGGSKKGGRTVPSEPLVPRAKAKVPWNPAMAKSKPAAKPPLAKKVPVKDPWSFAFDSDEDKKEASVVQPEPPKEVEAPQPTAEPPVASTEAWDAATDTQEKIATPPPPKEKAIPATKPAAAKPKAPIKNEDDFWDLDSYKKETKSPAPTKPAIRAKPGLLRKDAKEPTVPKPQVARETKVFSKPRAPAEPQVAPVSPAPEPVPDPVREPVVESVFETAREPEVAPVTETFETQPEPELELQTNKKEASWTDPVKTTQSHQEAAATDLEAFDGDLVDDKTLDAQWQEAFTTGTESWDLGDDDIEQFVPEPQASAHEPKTSIHEAVDAWPQQPTGKTKTSAIQQEDSWTGDTEAPSHVEAETAAPEPEQPAAWSFDAEESMTQPIQEPKVSEPVPEPKKEETHDIVIRETEPHEHVADETDPWAFDNDTAAKANTEPKERATDDVQFWSSEVDKPSEPEQAPDTEAFVAQSEQADPWSFDVEKPASEEFAIQETHDNEVSVDDAPEQADAWDFDIEAPQHAEKDIEPKEQATEEADPWAFEVDEEAQQQEELVEPVEPVIERREVPAEPATAQEPNTESADAEAFSFDVDEEAMEWGPTDDDAAPTVTEHRLPQPELNEPGSPAAQSTKSFARTVSHDVSFNDDDDGDWNLSRTDSDPFKFMPQSNRTNSFPPVPPAAEEPEHALQSSQALDILEETEAEDQQAETTRESRAEDTIGGELHHAETEAAEARFEEGVPLLPTDKEAPAEESAVQTSSSFAKAFDDEDEDEFFTQAHKGEADEQESAFESIQRKSTMQVMESATEGDAASDLAPTADSDAPAAVHPIAEEPEEEPSKTEGDLDSKWEAAFGDDEDEDLLPDDQAATAEAIEDVDAQGFLGSDDEGLLLEDETPAPVEQAPSEAPSGAPSKPSTANRYAPAPKNYQPTQLPSSVSAPALNNYGFNQNNTAPPPLPTADEPKVASFADKSKSGYSSPYDLPTDLINTRIKPRKSLQQLKNAPAPPPKDAAAAVPPPPAPGAFSKPPTGPPRSKENFFEELPMTTKSRPASRHSNRAPSPAQVPHMPAGPPQLPRQTAPIDENEKQEASHAPEPETQPRADIPNLVAPARANPYAALPAGGPPAPFAGNASRYSPAPSQSGKSASAPPPAAPSSRYSPAPVPPAQSHSQSPPQGQLPHLPRTSSPLAHFEVNNGKSTGEPSHPDRRASSGYEPRMNRVSSLPPTTEVDEEDDDEQPYAGRSISAAYPSSAHGSQGRYSPKPVDSKMPPASPSKRLSNPYAPQAAGHQSQQPPRAQAQSPSALRGKPHMPPVYEGRSGAPQTEAASNVIKASSQPAYAGFGRPRGASLTMGFVPPTDRSENDPLNRWQGAPIITWSVGGTMVTAFPKNVSRYGMNQNAPTTVRTSGEVKMHTIRDAAPLPERLVKFPGPLKGKSKKKEVLSWLSAGIDTLSQELPDVSLHQHLSLEAKRSIERLLLWKLLRVFVEHDGHLEGNANVEQAVRNVLSPIDASGDNSDMNSNGLPLGGMQASSVTAMHADVIDSGAIEQIRNNLLKGDREAAVWSAVDKRLWGHAMLIAHTVSADLYQRVAQEFVRKEVNYTGHSNESLGAFYKILSGNHDDCVDELVPSHARAGLQLMSTQVSAAPTADVMDGLDKWRETLCLVLSNRSADDIRGLKSLGQLLASYGRAEAAQVCFIFSRGISVFGGADEPNVDFVLLGADHRSQSDSFAKETEALQLSEIYEYALSLSGAAATASSAPHLAGYKLHHAVTLAEYGMRDKALAYCESISSAITAQTKRSPYYHPVLETAVDDFMKRLKQAPKDDSSSWMSKPSMNKVSDSMWNRFNKFVAGDDSDANGSGPEAESGPFARIASTPNLSRSPSVNNFDVYGGGAAGFSMNNIPPPLPAGNSAASSKYAPTSAAGAGAAMPPPFEYQPPVPAPGSNGRAASPYTPAPYEPSYPSQAPGPQSNGGYPGAPAETNYGYQPQSYAPYAPSVPEAESEAPASSPPAEEKDTYQAPNYQPNGAPEPDSASTFQPSTYEPPQSSAPVEVPEEDGKAEEEEGQGGSGGYEPPSFQPYGYEPPSYEPAPAEEEDADDVPQPKKKTFMDDDNDDDIPALRTPAAAQEKSKEEIDKENADLVKKIAEDEAKRDAEEKAAKKGGGWGFGGWFGGGAKKQENLDPAKKAIRAKLGEANSFVYDPELKRWINKAPGAEQVEAPKPTPPPPKGGPRSVSGTPPPMGGTPPPLPRSVSTSMAPPPRPQSAGMPPSLPRPSSSAGNNSGPPSRPATSMSNASSIDDLLGAAAPRKAGGKKPRKSGRYVDVMAK